MIGLPGGEKIEDICNRLDTIPPCDGRTDGRTSCHGIVRAIYTRRVVKLTKIGKRSQLYKFYSLHGVGAVTLRIRTTYFSSIMDTTIASKLLLLLLVLVLFIFVINALGSVV